MASSSALRLAPAGRTIFHSDEALARHRFQFPSPNPVLFANDKSTAGLPQNLQDVVAAIAKHSGGIALKHLKVAKLGPKTTAWLVRSLCKHGFVKAVVEEKPERARKTTKAAAK